MDQKRVLISEFARGQAIDQAFLVLSKDLRTTKTGDLYAVMGLGDKSGKISARMWQCSERIFQSIKVEGFMQIKGRIDEYRGELQFIVEGCMPIKADSVDLAEFVATTKKDIESMFAELLEILRQIKDKPIRLLMKKFMEDHELVAAFKRSPAAMQMHHAFVGGLLEHTLNIARSAQVLLPLYPQLNADLVYAGVFLHDLGKTAELSSGAAVNYTDRGLLVGHITIATLWVAQKAALVGEDMGQPFPVRTLNLLEHLILSHHGVYEYGSPKLPAIPEAFFIHYLDNLDAKMFMTAEAINSTPDSGADFTAYQRSLETRIYRRSGDLTEQD